MTTEKSYTGWYFLFIIIIIYLITAIVSLPTLTSALTKSGKIFMDVIPILLLIFILMVLTNYFVKTKSLIKHMGEGSGIKGWIIAVITGILSLGPIYMWYPLLNDLQKQGVRNGLIATFLYNRAVKIPLLPLLITYFGLTYSIVLMTIMIFISIIQGITTEKILRMIS